MLTSAQFNLPPNLLSSLCYIESKHDITAVHHDDGTTDSLGVCQIKLQTAKELGFKSTAKDLMDPKTNIYYAGKYLNHQLHRYNDTRRAVIAYNMGSAKALTSSKYQRKVYTYWREYGQSKRIDIRY